MIQRCAANGLIAAGLVVTVIGLGMVLVRVLDIPREWTTLLVGLALLLAGVVRRALRWGDAA
jgi:hypothetical protein